MSALPEGDPGVAPARGTPRATWLLPLAFLLGLATMRGLDETVFGPELRPGVDLGELPAEELEAWAERLSARLDRQGAAGRLEQVRQEQVRRWIAARRAAAASEGADSWAVVRTMRAELDALPPCPPRLLQELVTLAREQEQAALAAWVRETRRGFDALPPDAGLTALHEEQTAVRLRFEAAQGAMNVGLIPRELGPAIEERGREFQRAARERYLQAVERRLEVSLGRPAPAASEAFALLAELAAAPWPGAADTGIELQLAGTARALWDHYRAAHSDPETLQTGLTAWEAECRRVGASLGERFAAAVAAVGARAGVETRTPASPRPVPPRAPPPSLTEGSPGTSDPGASSAGSPPSLDPDPDRGTTLPPPGDPGERAYLAPGLVVVPLDPAEWKFSYPGPMPDGMPTTFPRSKLTHFGSFAERTRAPTGTTRIVGLYVADGPPALVLNALAEDLEAADAPYVLGSREQDDWSLLVPLERELRPTITGLKLFRRRGSSPPTKSMRLECRDGLWSRALGLEDWSGFLTLDARDAPEFSFLLECDLGTGNAAAGTTATFELQACREDDGVADADLSRHYTAVTRPLNVTFRRGDRETNPFVLKQRVDDCRYFRIRVVEARCARRQEGAIRAFQVGYGERIKTILLVSTGQQDLPALRAARRLSDADTLTLEHVTLDTVRPLETHWDRIRLATQVGPSREDVTTAVQRASGNQVSWFNSPELSAFTPTAQPARLAVLGRAGLNWARLVSVALESIPRQPTVAGDLVLELDAEVHDPRLSQARVRITARVGARSPR